MNTETDRTLANGAAAEALLRMQRKLRAVAVLEVVFAGVAAVCIALLAAGLTDYLLRLPAWLRTVLLAGGIAAMGSAALHRLVPAWRLRPSLTTLALRVERSAMGLGSGLAGRLASGIALASAPAEADEPASIAALRRQAASDADRLIEAVDPSRLISTSLLRHHGATAGVGVLAVALIGILSPSTLGTGTARLLLPLSEARWPSRYEVADGTGLEVHPAGSAIPLRARVLRTPRDVGATPVEVVYRISTDDGAGAWRREAMTPQRVFDPLAGGEVFERLLDPGVVVAGASGEPVVLEYAFDTPDFRSPVSSVLLVPPPEVESMAVRVTPPSYAADVQGAWLTGESTVDMAGGAESQLGPVLSGSRLELIVSMNKPATAGSAAPVRGTDSQDPPADLDVRAEGRALRLAWTAQESARIRLSLIDEYGLESLEEFAGRIEVEPDRAPSAAVTEPVRDETVLPTAVVRLRGEGRDDVELVRVGLDMQRRIVPGGEERSGGAAPEAIADPEPITREQSAGVQFSVEATLDLGRLGLIAGDELWITAIAEDGFDSAGAGHGVQRSEPRRLRIISETALLDEILSDLAGVRRTAIRLDERQAEINERSGEATTNTSEDWSAMARDQASIREGADRAAGTLAAARDRLERNRVRDEALEGVLDRAEEAAERAAASADTAASGLGAAARGEAGAPSEASLEAAREVRRALEDLARSLDQGQDAWVVRRALEGLLSDQQALSERTAEAARETVGRRTEELTEQERSTLDEIARRQLDLADRAREVLDEIDQKADQSEATDAGQAAALRAAARRGREQGVASELERAADAVSQNRGAEAGRAQQAAQAQIEEMLRDLETAERQRDQELRRALLSLVESIEALVTQQELELTRLDGPADGEGLAQGMIALHRNTLAITDEALGNAQTRAIAEPLARAADHQTEAILALRASPVMLNDARAAENESLAELRRALDIAEQELDDAEQRETERRKQALASAYRTLLERQVQVRQSTEPLAEARLSRRDRQTLRGIAPEQVSIRDDLARLPNEYPEIADAGVFRFTHERLDDNLSRVADRLESGEIDAAEMLRQRSSITLLQGLIDALRDPEPSNDDGFSEGSSGGGAGQQGGEPQLLPPLAELQLLRTLQQDLLEQTRAAEALANAGDLVRALGEQQRAVADHAEALLEAMQQQTGPELSPPMPEPAPEEGEPR